MDQIAERKKEEHTIEEILKRFWGTQYREIVTLILILNTNQQTFMDDLIHWCVSMLCMIHT